MLRSKIVVAVLAAAMSLSVVPESFARGGFGGHSGGGHFGGGARFGGFAARPGFAGARLGFVGPRAGFYPHRRFFAPGFAFGSGLALGGYPYYYYDNPYYYDQGYYDDAPVAVSPDAISYCAQRFRTYNPATGMYIGRGGVPHPCP